MKRDLNSRAGQQEVQPPVLSVRQVRPDSIAATFGSGRARFAATALACERWLACER